MCFEKFEQRGQQPWLTGALPELVCPDSGQVEEALRPPRLIERCGKRRERESTWVGGIGWRLAVQGLGLLREWEGRIGEDPDR